MFKKEAEERYKQHLADPNYYESSEEESYLRGFREGAEFGYNKAKEELIERLDNATEIIELMKDLFFDCWQEKGYKAIQFEQRVNDFLRGD